MQTGTIIHLKEFPEIALLVIEEIDISFFKCVVLAKKVKQGMPVISFGERTSLACLPLWIYVTTNILKQIATYIQPTKLSEETLKEISDYCYHKPISKTTQSRYIKAIVKSLAPINTASIFEYLQNLEINQTPPKITTQDP